MRRDAFIGLGSNVGDRTGMLAAALVALEAEEGLRVQRVSHVYESRPWGVTDQPSFANAVALVSFDGEADELLGLMAAVEQRLGRVRGEPNGPRVIDLDLLLFGGEEWDSPQLKIPHPRMLERDFVVRPLLEVAPGLRMPGGESIDARAATEGEVTGVLGAVPGYEEVTPGEGGEGGEEETRAYVPAGERSVALTEREAADTWVPIGPSRYERGAGNASTDFDLLFYESVLLQAGIPCRFDPHRPNEGFITFPIVGMTVRLLVPASRAREAQELIDRISTTPPQGGD